MASRRTPSRKLTLEEAAAEAWRRRLIPLYYALSSSALEELDDLRRRTAWRTIVPPPHGLLCASSIPFRT